MTNGPGNLALICLKPSRHHDQLLNSITVRHASGSRLFFCREYSQDQANPKRESSSLSQDSKSVAEIRENPYSHLTVGEKVKQASKDAYYTGIIIVGVGVTALMFYAIFRELFSRRSPNSIYTEALELCKQSTKVIDAVGEPIKGYGETTARGRRRHVSHMEYVQDGVNHMRMKFYIEGCRRKGTVHLEVQEDSNGNYQYRYLFVDLDQDFPRQTIILKDNR